jgi:hypothetical protein
MVSGKVIYANHIVAAEERPGYCCDGIYMKYDIGLIDMIFRVTLGIVLTFIEDLLLKNGGVLLASSL